MTPELAPVVEDISGFVLGGRSTNARIGIAQAVEAERIGYRRVWISERYNMKEAAVLFGGICASTTRLGVGTGAMTISARPPIVTAAIGATVHSAFGPRCVLGLGIGGKEYNRPHGLPVFSYQALIDYATIIKRLYRGEEVNYEGPAGSYQGLLFPDLYDGPQPEIWHIHLGGPKASKVCANPCFDGTMIGFGSTAEATYNTVRQIHEECERIGRDPKTLRICTQLHTAPEFNAAEASISGEAINNPSYGGMVTFDSLKAITTIFITQPTLSDITIKINGWDTKIVEKIRNHPLFSGMQDITADHRFRNRADIMEAAKLLPDAWIRDTAAVGSTDECVKTFEQFKAAGADEIATYTSAPAQNAHVLAAWHERRAKQAA